MELVHLNPNSILQIIIFVHLCETFLGILPNFPLLKMSKCFYDTSIDTATRAARCGSLLERAQVYRMLAPDERSGHQDLRGSGHRSVIPYVHGRMGVVLLKRWLFSRLPCVTLSALATVIKAAGFTSIHFVNLSTAMNVCVNPPLAFLKGPTKFSPMWRKTRK
jgi:hypothetical protein